jgi:hypothetical protein
MTTTAKTMTILCPNWCRQDEHQGHEPHINADGQLEVEHMGPRFGSYIYGSAEQVGETVTATVTVSDLDSRDMDPRALWLLAADALDAGQWLESQQG